MWLFTEKVCQPQIISGALNLAFTLEALAQINTQDLIFHGLSERRCEEESPESIQIVKSFRKTPTTKDYVIRIREF